MGSSNFKETAAGEKAYQTWLIEDTWEGTVFLEARVVRTWQGVCGFNKILEDRDGRFFWWTVLFAPEGGLARQRLVAFPDWESLAAELGLNEIDRNANRFLTRAVH